MSSSWHFRCRMDPRTCWTRREEGLSGIAGTCGKSREEAEAIGVPLAGGLIDRAKPASGPGLALCQLTRRVSRNGRSGAGLWRTCEVVSPSASVPVPRNPLARSVLIAAGAIRVGVKSRECEVPPVGCGHHPAKFGPRAGCATHLPIFRKAKPACGPPDWHLHTPATLSRGIVFACPIARGSTPRRRTQCRFHMVQAIAITSSSCSPLSTTSPTACPSRCSPPARQRRVFRSSGQLHPRRQCGRSAATCRRGCR